MTSTSTIDDNDEIARLLEDIEAQIADIQVLERTKRPPPPPLDRGAFVRAFLLVAFAIAIVRTCLRMSDAQEADPRRSPFTADDYLLLVLFSAVDERRRTIA